MKEIKMRWPVLLMTILICSNAFGGYQTTANILVSKFDVYDDYGGGGDIAIWAATNVTQCPDGVYFKGTSPGKSGMLATLLSAINTGTSLKFYVQDTDIWSGTSSKKLCVAKGILQGQ